MKNFFFLALLCLVLSFAQAQTYQISFLGKGASTTVDSVIVENLTQGLEVSLEGNDTLNLLLSVGFNEQKKNMEKHVIVYPNPMTGSCQVRFTTSYPDITTFELLDITGRRVMQSHYSMKKGSHTFSLKGLGNGLYILNIFSSHFSYSVKIISLNRLNEMAVLKFIETKMGDNIPVIQGNPGVEPGLKNKLDAIEMPYNEGDMLKFRGKAGVHRAVTMLTPTGDQVVTFLFVECVDENGQNYATVQIGSQIWMAENLNAGNYINSSQEQTDNGISEKYCYDDDEMNCEIYGGLYTLNELMNYESIEGTKKGKCPQGFHVATHSEWEQMVEYLGGDNVAGGKLKETGFDHWYSPNLGATDASGFEALPGGMFESGGTFQLSGMSAFFWDSLLTSPTTVWAWLLNFNDAAIINIFNNTNSALSCRCIQDNTVEMTILAGDTSKTWKLLRDVSTGRYPLEAGPADHSAIWWAMGYNNGELTNRPCMLNDEWTFGRDGSLTFEAKGDFWAEGGIFDPGNACQSTDDMIAITGEDCSDWGDGVHEFEINPGSDPKLKAIGHGAFLGFYKSATEYEVMDLDPMVQDSVVYNIVKLTDGTTDTLIIETFWYDNIGDPEYLGYWRYVLVHYDDPDDEPPFPGYLPQPNFNMIIEGNTVICTNTSQFCDSYIWDFGDGTIMTTEDATHTYTAGDFYHILLTGISGSDSATTTQYAFIIGDSPPLTEDLLQGGPWKIVVDEMTVFVGPGMGTGGWWAVPKSGLDGSTPGTDDWSCMADDEFTFSAGGVFTYDGTGVVRNDGYFGLPQGCWDESGLQGNAAYFKSGTHSYVFTPASGDDRAVITLTNGLNRAAFIGFYKGYYGGENVDIIYPPNGGYPTNTYEVMGYAVNPARELLEVTVDITQDHSGSAAWTMILERVLSSEF